MGRNSPSADGSTTAAAAGRVSVVVPVYNSEPYLRECIDSVLAQTYHDIEVIAVDGGSTDGSLDTLEGYGGRVRVVHEPGSGISATVNTGVRLMTGGWLKRVDSDDVLHPDAVSELVATSASADHDAKSVAFLDHIRIDREGAVLPGVHANPYDPLDSFGQGVRMVASIYADPKYCLLPRRALDEVGPFNEEYRVAEDWEFNLRLLLVHKWRLHRVPRPLYRYRMHAGQTTHDLAEYQRAGKRAVDSVLGMLDPGEQAAYRRAVSRYLDDARFLREVWLHANPGAAAASRRAHSGRLLDAAARMMHKSPLVRAAWASLRARNASHLRGHLWARRNGRSELVSQCAGRPDFECDDVLKVFGGSLPASGLPKRLAPEP